MTDIERIKRLEEIQWEQQREIAKHDSRISSLETSRDNERTRHSSTPAWVFGTISAAVSIAVLLFNLYLAGLKP